jgi:broad specificity phosphatase PhoE
VTEVTVVHLLRHGEVSNPGGVLYGRLPGYHLSEVGIKMAERLADVLADRDIVAVWSSPLERARETAQPIADRFGVSVQTDERLSEATNHFEGLTFGVGNGSLRHPRHWWRMRNPFRPSWGEPYSVLAGRMLAVMSAARDAAVGHEIVCVSHQLPIWTVRCFVEGRRLWHHPRERQCSLASLTSFRYEGRQIRSVTYSEPAADLIPVKGKRFAAGA